MMVSPKRKAAIFPLINMSMVPMVSSSQFLKLVAEASSKVVGCALQNVKRLLEESKEAHRLLENRQRRVNTYQVLFESKSCARSPSNRPDLII